MAHTSDWSIAVLKFENLSIELLDCHAFGGSQRIPLVYQLNEDLLSINSSGYLYRGACSGRIQVDAVQTKDCGVTLSTGPLVTRYFLMGRDIPIKKIIPTGIESGPLYIEISPISVQRLMIVLGADWSAQIAPYLGGPAQILCIKSQRTAAAGEFDQLSNRVPEEAELKKEKLDYCALEGFKWEEVPTNDSLINISWTFPDNNEILPRHIVQYEVSPEGSSPTREKRSSMGHILVVDAKTSSSNKDSGSLTVERLSGAEAYDFKVCRTPALSKLIPTRLLRKAPIYRIHLPTNSTAEDSGSSDNATRAVKERKFVRLNHKLHPAEPRKLLQEPKGGDLGCRLLLSLPGGANPPWVKIFSCTAEFQEGTGT